MSDHPTRRYGRSHVAAQAFQIGTERQHAYIDSLAKKRYFDDAFDAAARFTGTAKRALATITLSKWVASEMIDWLLDDNYFKDGNITIPKLPITIEQMMARHGAEAVAPYIGRPAWVDTTAVLKVPYVTPSWTKNAKVHLALIGTVTWELPRDRRGRPKVLARRTPQLRRVRALCKEFHDNSLTKPGKGLRLMRPEDVKDHPCNERYDDPYCATCQRIWNELEAGIVPRFLMGRRTR